VPTVSPVSFPFLWGFASLPWVHWDGDTNSVLQRNLGQALGLGATLTVSTGTTTLRVQNIHSLENLVAPIQPPRWPTSFGDLREAAVARGRSVFDKARCQGCHEEVVSYTQSQIGTDTARLDSFNAPLKAGPFPDLLGQRMADAERIAFAVAGITDQATQAEYERHRQSKWQRGEAYAARSLHGIWATAPFLRNGSVASLADLLTPSERPDSICVGRGGVDFDPVRVGYSSQGCDDVHSLDTRVAGNRHVGHTYGEELSAEDKDALIEFLKQF